MKITYSCYKYAPEQLQVTINGVALPSHLKARLPAYDLLVAQDTKSRVRMIRESLFMPVKTGRHFTIKKIYDAPEKQGLNESRSGRADYATAKAVLEQLKQGALESARFTVSARLIG